MQLAEPRDTHWTRLAWPVGLGALAALAVLVLARAWFAPLGKLVAAYMVTPLAKEAWVALAQPLFGVPAWLAVLALLATESLVILAVLLAFPVEKLAKLAPRIERVEQRVRASPLARRGLAVALAGIIALPFHSGGAILGSLVGRALGLPRLHTYLAVISGIGARFVVVLVAYYGWVALQ
jgi:hypothetical protein